MHDDQARHLQRKRRGRALEYGIISAPILVGLAAGLSANPMPSKGPPSLRLQELSVAVLDSSLAREAEKELRALILEDSELVGPARSLLVASLVNQGKPTAEVLASADTAANSLPPNSQTRVAFYCKIASFLLDRREPASAIEKAVDKATGSLDGTEGRATLDRLRTARGRLHLLKGQADSALSNLLDVALADPDNEDALLYVGGAYEMTGKLDSAIDYYSRSAAMFGHENRRAQLALERSYWARHHSLKGMHELLAGAQEASRRRLVFEGKTCNQRLPGLRLQDLEGGMYDLGTVKGQVTVIAFWGTWCGPCHLALPRLQALSDRYARRVRFLTIDSENETSENQDELVGGFLARRGLRLKVLVDRDGRAVEKLGVTAFPTVFVSDEEGVIRFKNTGFTDRSEAIVEAQIRSLLSL